MPDAALVKAPIVLVWDCLSTHVSHRMRGLIDARSWLTVFPLPACAPELNAVQYLWAHVKHSLANLAGVALHRLAARVRNRLKRIQTAPTSSTASSPGPDSPSTTATITPKRLVVDRLHATETGCQIPAVTIVLSTPTADGVREAIAALREWQHDEAPMQLHPGDIGWNYRLGTAETAAVVRAWSRDGRILAVGMLDSPTLVRMTVAPDAFQDEDLARRRTHGLPHVGC